MPRRALLVLVFIILALCCASSQEPSCKTLLECQARVHSWEEWSDKNLPKCKAALKDTDTLQAENEELQGKVTALTERVDSASGTFHLVIAGVWGITLGIGCCIAVKKAVKNFWPFSAARRQLMVLILGAFWISGSALIAVNDSDLSKHPVNMLFTVLVYSLPALLFGGIGFWWFGKDKEKAQTATGK